MISIVEARTLPVPTERVWRFFSEEVEGSYAQWHPEHLRWKWLHGEPLERGSDWFADEWVGWMRIQNRFIVDDAEPERLFSYRLAFPSSLVRAGGSFRLLPANGGECRLIQEVRLGFSIPFLGPLVDLVIAAVAPVGEIRRHMQEEQARLAPLLAALDAKGDD